MGKRAEEKALKAFPDGCDANFCCKKKDGNAIIPLGVFVGILRNTYAKGFNESEKDVLNWKEVQLLCDTFIDVGLKSNLPARSQEFYEEVLREYKKRISDS